MEENINERNAEETDEAMCLEQKQDVAGSVLNLQGNPKEEGTAEKTDVAAATEKTAEPSIVEQSNENSNTKFVDKNPLNLLPYIEKYVTVQLERNHSYDGFIHSIDPITHSIILSVPKEAGCYQTTIIPGTSILDVTETPYDDSIVPPKRMLVREMFKDIQIKKKKIISWLKENHLPVTEDGDNVLFGGITLLPPYRNKDICTTNPLIALEIKKLLDKMPVDYQPT